MLIPGKSSLITQLQSAVKKSIISLIFSPPIAVA